MELSASSALPVAQALNDLLPLSCWLLWFGGADTWLILSLKVSGCRERWYKDAAETLRPRRAAADARHAAALLNKCFHKTQSSLSLPLTYCNTCNSDLLWKPISASERKNIPMVSQNYETRSQNCEIESYNYGIKSQNCGIKSQNCEIKSQNCELKVEIIT